MNIIETERKVWAYYRMYGPAWRGSYYSGAGVNGPLWMAERPGMFHEMSKTLGVPLRDIRKIIQRKPR